MTNILDQIYIHSPIWLQNFGISAYGLVWRNRRFGGHFHKYVDEFSAREKFNIGEWRDYQQKELRRLLAYANQNVPYYRDTFNKSGFSSTNWNDFTLDDISRLPILEKESIRGNSSSFVAEGLKPRNLHSFNTSGTTGTPITIKFTNNMHRTWSAAYEVRVRHWAGVNNQMHRAMIGGRLVVPKARAEPPFWRYNFAEHQLYMSAFHISPRNAKQYVNALNHYKPDYLVGYASSHFFLARFIVAQGLQVHRPKAILTSSEKLTPEMRAVMEQAYNCQVFDAYSGVEACCLASECEYHRLHVSPDVGIIELLDENNQPVPPGVPGEIVATGLLNFEQPLIRYRTGDIAVWSDEPCPCGRNMPIIEELVGRLEDTVIGPDGQETVRFHGIFVGLPHIQEGQIIQETINHFRIRLVVESGFNDTDRKIIYNRFYERLGPVQLEYELVDRIERTERGKFRAVISKVPRHSII